MIRYAMRVAAGLGAVSLAGCLTATMESPVFQHKDVPVWAPFDACAARNTFHEWVVCAKLNQEATCSNSRACGLDARFKEVLAYAESLDLAVRRRQISEPEARSKWAEYRADRDRLQSQPKPDDPG